MNDFLTKDYLTGIYLEDKNSIVEVSRLTGFCASTISNRLKKYNIPKRPDSYYRKGMTFSEEWKAKISKAHKDKALSEEHKKRISEERKKNYSKYLPIYKKAARVLWDNHKERMCRIRKEQMTDEVKAKIAKQLDKREITSFEKKILDIIITHKLPFKYYGNNTKLAGFYPDFVNEKDKVIIEVFYDYFKIKQYGSVECYTKQRYAIFKKFGYDTIFIDNHMLKSLSENDLVNFITKEHRRF